MMTFYSLTRPHKALIFSILTLGWLSQNLHAQIACPTIMPRSIPLSICSQADSLSFVYTNNNQNQRVGTAKATIEFPYGTKIRYRAGSVKGTSSAGSVTENNVADLNKPIFTIPIPNYLEGVTITFAVDVSCEAMDLARAALPKMKITMDYTGSFNPAANPLMDVSDSEPFNIQSPILTIAPDSAARSRIKNTPFSRCFTIANTGYGFVDRVYLYDTTMVGASYTSATAGGQPLTLVQTTDITWKGKPAKMRQFIVAGLALGSDKRLTVNESVVICQNMMLDDCGSFQTSLRVEYKCNDAASPCAVATGNTTINTDMGNPDLIPTLVTYEKPNGCATRHATFKVKNTGTGVVGLTGQALNIKLLVGFLKDSIGSAMAGPYATDVPITNLKLNNVLVATTLKVASAPNGAKVIDLSQFVADPDGATGLSDVDGDGKFADLGLNDEILVEFDYAPDYLTDFNNCNMGYKSREFIVRTDYEHNCHVASETMTSNLFVYRNLLTKEATQLSPEPFFNSYPLTKTFTYSYSRDIKGYDLSAATGVFKITDPYFFDLSTTVRWNGSPLTGTIIGDTMYVNVSNVANYLNGSLEIDATNKCPYDVNGKGFFVKFEIRYNGCGQVRAPAHCERNLTYSGNWGCGGAWCYTLKDVPNVAHNRVTTGYTNATETTPALQDTSTHWVGDLVQYKNQIISNGDATSYNPNNLRPYMYVQINLPTSGGGDVITYPLLDELLVNPPYKFESGSVSSTSVSGSYLCTLSPAVVDQPAAVAFARIRNEITWANTKATYPAYSANNSRDTAINGIVYTLYDVSGKTYCYLMHYIIGYAPWCAVPASYSFNNNLDMTVTANFRVNPNYYHPSAASFGYTAFGFPQYLAASYYYNIGHIFDLNNPLSFFRQNNGAVCGAKQPPRTLIDPRMSIHNGKKHYQATCTLKVEHEMGYGGVIGDQFPNEFRAPWKIDTLKVEMPTGYRYKAGTAQLYYEQNGVGSYVSIANPPTNTGTVLFLNPGTWALTDDASGFRTGYKIRYDIEPIGAQTGQTFNIPYAFSIRRRNFTTSTVVLRDTFTMADKIPQYAMTTYDVNDLSNKHCNSTQYIDFKVTNQTDASMLNTYIAFVGNTGVSIDSIKNITNNSALINTPLVAQAIVAQNAYGTNDRFAQIGTLTGGNIAVYRVYYKSTSCTKDSIIGYVDWGCTYPVSNQPNLASPTIQTTTAHMTASNPGLQAALIYNNTEITLCDDVTYEFEFKNTQLSDAYNVNLKAMLPPGMRYIASSAKFKLPAGAGTYANFAAGNLTVVNAGTSDSLVLKLGQFDSPTNLCGLKTAADTANSKIRVQFKANYTTCPPPMATRTAKFYTSATNFCKDTTLQYNIVSKPIHFTDEDPQVRNSLACTVVTMPTINGNSASAQTLTCTFKVKNEGSGGTTIGKDSIQINLPKGLTYSSTANGSGLVLPTTPRIVNGSEGQTLMYFVPAGMAVGDETQFNLVVTTDPNQFNGHCNKKVPIAIRTLSYRSPICVAKNLTCEGNSGCEIQGGAFDDANLFCCPVICLPVIARRN